MAISVFVVDDSDPFRERATALLQDMPGIDVVGAAASGGEAASLLERMSPDLVLLDLELPGLNGFAVLEHILGRAGAPRVVIVTLHGDQDRRALALSLGASGFVVKSDLVMALPGLLEELFPGQLL